MKWIPLFILFILLPLALAHEDAAGKNLDHIIRDNSIFLIWTGSIVILLAICISFFLHADHHHWPFIIILISAVAVTGYLVFSTLTLNMISQTKGPVHWHADFEIYHCGQKINLIDPKGLSNKIGTPVFHEHNDDRMHVEGVVVEIEHVSLAEFFKTIGGELTSDKLSIPTNEGTLMFKNGDLCDGESSEINVFLYKVINPDPKRNSGFVYEKTKLEDFKDYVLSPYFNVPPGDCIIIELDEPMEDTEHICETYQIAIEKGDLLGS